MFKIVHFSLRVIHCYTNKHRNKPHGEYAGLGDRVLCAVKGEKIQGIVVGMARNQIPGVPRTDTSNVVLIEANGNPLGTRIHAPVPNHIRAKLKMRSHPKKADYTKILALATSFV